MYKYIVKINDSEDSKYDEIFTIETGLNKKQLEKKFSKTIENQQDNGDDYANHIILDILLENGDIKKWDNFDFDLILTN
jgi:hypothetical protein